MKYSEFDYKKVVAVLSQLMAEDELNQDKRYLTVSTYEDNGPYDCFNALGDLFEEGDFKVPARFSLVFAQLRIGEEGNEPMLVFIMGQETCSLGSYYSQWNEKNKQIFEPIFPLDEVKDPSWEKVLALFIDKIKKIVDKNLALIEGADEVSLAVH